MISPGEDEPPGWRSVPVVRPGQAEQVDHVPGELWLVESGHVTTIPLSDCQVLGRELGLAREVVRVWFCNRRQRQRRHGGDTGQS